MEGVSFAVLATETLRRHARGYPPRAADHSHELPNPGEFHWRSGGERHMWDPETIANLQVAARTNSPEAYRQFAEHANNDARTRCTLRGLLRLQEVGRQRTDRRE